MGGHGRRSYPYADVSRDSKTIEESVPAEFVAHLRTTTNRRGCPFQVRPIKAYRSSVIALSRWLDAMGGGPGCRCSGQMAQLIAISRPLNVDNLPDLE